MGFGGSISWHPLCNVYITAYSVYGAFVGGFFYVCPLILSCFTPSYFIFLRNFIVLQTEIVFGILALAQNWGVYACIIECVCLNMSIFMCLYQQHWKWGVIKKNSAFFCFSMGCSSLFFSRFRVVRLFEWVCSFYSTAPPSDLSSYCFHATCLQFLFAEFWMNFINSCAFHLHGACFLSLHLKRHIFINMNNNTETLWLLL